MGLAPAGASAAEPSLQVFRRDIQPVLEKYCYDCHGGGVSKGGVTLDEFSTPAELGDQKLWARVLRNVRAHIMPPADETPLPTPEAEKIMAWIKRDAFGLDPAKPDPGRVTVRRLNRVEYHNTIRDLTGVDYDTQKEFPADDTGYGFDNIADVLTVSPLLLEKYLDAAQTIIGKAVVTKPRMVVEKSVFGREFATIKVDTTLPEPPKPAASADAPPTPAPDAAPASALAANAGVPPAGAPAQPGRGQGFQGRGRGRGGPPPAIRPVPTVENESVVLSYYTPALVATKHRVEHAGKYQIVLSFLAQETYADNLFDLNKCQMSFAVDGEKLLDQEFVREGYGKRYEFTYERELTAGEHELSVEIKPLGPETPPYRKLRMRIDTVTVRGPLAPEFWVKTPGYDKYFPREIPADPQARQAYAREILQKFATKAFRRPVDTATLDRLVALAEKVYTRPANTFENGITQAMVAVLASPTFIFREDSTEPLKPGQTHPFVDEYALASRLSYFLWSSMPDEQLIQLAATGRLRANLPAQLDRMLADVKSEEFVRNFTGQWLQARDITTVQIVPEDVYLRDHPDAAYEEARDTLRKLQAIPQEERTAEQSAALTKARQATFAFNRQTKPELNERLRRAMLQETEMTFGYILKENRSLLELLESDYTFLNEELAKHYGIEGVEGTDMRKVTLPPDSPRGGVLTQGTTLAVTSNPTRTSPVKRGVFILDAILGTPPAPPPPNIPPLEDAASPEKLRSMSLRETLALHATNPVCYSCHSRMDPLGLALENFNAMGMWRTTDGGQPVQPAGKLITGETFKDIRELKHVLATSHRRDFYYCVSEKMLTYALGRGLEAYDATTLDQLVAQLEASGGNAATLVRAIVNSTPFQQRRQTVAPLAGDAATRTGATRLAQERP